MPRTDVRITRKAGVATLILDGPPTNALTQPLRAALDAALDQVLADPALKVMVLTGSALAFATSPPVRDETPLWHSPSLGDIARKIEHAAIPVVAALSGQALGAGAALALACHYRMADPRAVIGFPDVSFAQMPEAGTTQRLPRLVGMETAARLLLTGRPMRAPDAAKAYLVDALSPPGQAVQAAIDLGQQRKKPRPISALPVPQPDLARPYLEKLQAHPRKAPGVGPVQTAILEALTASLDSFAQGLTLEERLARTAWEALPAHGLRAAARARDLSMAARGTARVTVKRAGILGHSPLATDLAQTALAAGLEVCLWGAQAQDADAAGRAVIQALAAQKAKGQLTDAQATAAQGRLTQSTAAEDMANCQIVIEASGAAPEGLATLLSPLAPVLPPNVGLLLTAPFDQAQALPPNLPPHLWCSAAQPLGAARIWEVHEIAAARPTTDEAKAAAASFAKFARRQIVFAGAGSAPIGPRLAAAYWQAAAHVIALGVPPDQVDAAMQDYGFARGPCAQQKALGLDITDAPAAPRPTTPDVIQEYIATAVQNAAAHIAAEPGITPAAIELVALHALGFPQWRGGPLFSIDEEGAGQVLSRIWAYGVQDHQFWRPARLIERAVSTMQPLAALLPQQTLSQKQA